MRNLILALNRANLSSSDMESVLTEMESWVDSKIARSEQKMMTESIAPTQKETDGLRSEVRLLAETMKYGFEKMDQKIDFMGKNLEMEITSTRKNLESQITATQKNLELQIASSQKNLELQIASTRENLETQIKANEKQLGLVQKLLWIVLTLVLGLFAKAIHLF